MGSSPLINKSCMSALSKLISGIPKVRGGLIRARSTGSCQVPGCLYTTSNESKIYLERAPQASLRNLMAPHAEALWTIDVNSTRVVKGTVKEIQVER